MIFLNNPKTTNIDTSDTPPGYLELINIFNINSESNLDYTTFTNSQILAQNGTLTINSKQDTNIIGANLLAKDVVLNVEGNLLVNSKQNLLESDSYNIGLNVGVSVSGNGNVGGSGGFNLGNGYQSRAWVDNITSIIGTNSVAINVGSTTANSGNTNIIGAMIANATKDQNGNLIDNGNLTLNTKTFKSGS